MERNDAVDTVFFARELEQVKARSYDIADAPLSADRLIPVDSTTSDGADTVTYTQYDRTGIAKIIASYADDMPMADVSGKEFSSRIYSIGLGYGYTAKEIRNAQFTGKPLNARKRSSAVRGHQIKLNNLALFGDTEYGIQGWLTNANIPAAPVSNGAGGDSEWSTKTPDEILADLNGAVASIRTVTNGVGNPNVIALPVAQHQLIHTTARSSTSDTTIAEFFLRANPGFVFEQVPEFAGAFAGDTDGMVVYERSMDKMWQEVPMMLREEAPQQENLSYKVPMESMHGGTIVPYPLEQVFRYGI